MTANGDPRDERPDNVTPIKRGSYGDEPVSEEDVLLEDWMSTLDPEKHRLNPPEDEALRD
ncbi:hypothetical protein [Paramicrobacterium fandaimingii]|uniref:hypothetical protein n=1 Tax=Paramicrobacterium fandaimingii TaxID=2708079 RepID=UPI00141DC686|nr:hypothetical protein [Microbacterium fandaimingii]